MTCRVEPTPGLSRWRSAVLCAGVAVVCAVGSAAAARAYGTYVANRESSVVSVIDTAGNTDRTTIAQCDTNVCRPNRLPSSTIQYGGANALAGYSNESLLGPWIFEALELPGYQYIVFDPHGLAVARRGLCVASCLW